MRNLKSDKTTIAQFLFATSILLMFFDAYEIISIPIFWIGNAIYFLIVIYLFSKNNLKLPTVFYVLMLISILPTLLNLKFDNLEFVTLRLFSFISFFLSVFLFSQVNNEEKVNDFIKNIIYFIYFISIYIFIAQIFDFYELPRNRSGTGIFGFDEQVVFWISESHRLLGTFREPVFFVSLVFPFFVYLNYTTKLNFSFYVLSGIVFGLTKSQLVLILIVIFLVFEIINKSFSKKHIILFTVFSIFFLIQLRECDISPYNVACPDAENKISAEKIDPINSESFQINFTVEIENDLEKEDTLNFLQAQLSNSFNLGFQNANSEYTKFLSKNVLSKTYYINRTLPEYLKVKYLSAPFGTGKYSLTYENINLQNNFLFNLFSVGVLYIVLLLMILIIAFSKSYKTGLKVLLFLIVISLSVYEDLLPIYGFFLGSMFKINKNENK